MMKTVEEVNVDFEQRQLAKSEAAMTKAEEKREKCFQKIEQLQKVVGASLYRIIIDPIEPETESEGGLKYTNETIQAQEYLRYYGQVVSIGPLAFSDEKFVDVNGNRIRACEVGDWIVYGRHAGHDICVREGRDVRRMRAINDDEVIAVIHDIEQVKIPLV